MPEIKDVEGFVRDIDGALTDGHLSEEDWHIKLAAAPSYNLSAEQAERLIIERCVEQGAVIEHFEIQKLRELIVIAVPDKVLEASVQALLRRFAEERYRLTKLARPQAHVDRLVDERLDEAKLREEKPLRQKITERLHAAAGPGRSLRIEDWRRIYSGTLEELGISGGETSDLVGLFLDCRRELGIDIAKFQPEPEIPEPQPPVLEKLPLLPEPDEPSGSSSVLASLGKLVLISLVVAVLVFLLLRFLDREAGSADGSSVAVPYPRCDDDCAINLQRWTAELQQAPSSEALEGALQECDPYLGWEEAIRRDAKEKDADWKLCEFSMIVEEFKKRSGQTSG